MISRRNFLASLGIAAPAVCLGQPFSLSDQAFVSNAFIYPLDLGLSFSGAWGLVPLSRSASNLFTLVRVSDSAEQGISRVRRSANLIAINSHISGSTGRVKTLVDQTGNGNDATQATAGEQPLFSYHLGLPTGYGIGNRFWDVTGPTVTGRNFSIYFVWCSDERTSGGITTIPSNRPAANFAGGLGCYGVNDTRTATAGWSALWVTNPGGGGPGNLAANCSINIGVVNSRVGATRFRVNDIIKSSATQLGTTAAAFETLLQGPASIFSPGVKLIACLISTSHTDAQEEQVFKSLRAIVGTRAKDRCVFFDGDSITAGHDASTDFTDHRDLSWPYEMMQSINRRDVFASNRAVSEAFLENGASQARDLTLWGPMKLDAQITTIAPYNVRNVLCVFAGTNDLNASVTGETTYNRLVTYCQARKSAGWLKIIVINCIPRQTFDATKETERLDYNSRITANGNTDWDAVVDVAALNWKPGGAGDWTTNYQDGIHPNAAGRILIVNAVKPVLTPFL